MKLYFGLSGDMDSGVLIGSGKTFKGNCGYMEVVVPGGKAGKKTFCPGFLRI